MKILKKVSNVCKTFAKNIGEACERKFYTRGGQRTARGVKRPAPNPFLNLNRIRPADKIDPAREYVIRPARHYKNFNEI